MTFQRRNANSMKKDLDVLGNVLDELTERQRLILRQMTKTGQWNVPDNVLENVLETSATLAAFFGGDARTIRRDLNHIMIGIIAVYCPARNDLSR